MAEMKVLNGSEAIASGIQQINPDAVFSYPVSPSIEIIEKLAKSISNGHLDIELVNVESEESAMGACIGASAAGGRVFTATGSHGLSIMQEQLFVASSLRLPIVIAVVNRAMGAPPSIQSDYSDIFSQRDTGCIQIFSENAQESYDNIIQSFKIAEHADVRFPVMCAIDGVVASELLDTILVEPDDNVQDFVQKTKTTQSILDEPSITVGSTAGREKYFEFKLNQWHGFENSRKVIREVGKEYGDRFGRYYGYFESYRLEDAEYGIVIMGSSTGIAKDCVDELRKNNVKAGLLKLRIFRPFPHAEIKDALSGLKSVAVLDRVFSPGSFGGPLFGEIRTAMYDCIQRPSILSYIYGLGGRQIESKHFMDIFQEMELLDEKKQDITSKFVSG